MPQTSTYLPDESDTPSFDNAEKLNTSKPETWSLFLPSAIPSDDRSLCYKGVIETEKVLRLAQLQDGLVDLRRFRRSLRNLRLYFRKNMAGEGQKTQTKSRTIETGVNNRIKRAVCRYRIAYNALLELDPTGNWTSEYHELRDEDNRGPLKEAEEEGTGDGRYTPSWIWAAPSATTLPGDGPAAEQQEVNETARYEWMTCRARADRWAEEEELLQEEMRRVIVYLEWKSRAWSERVGARVGSCTPDIQNGIDAYSRKQAHIHRELAISFASLWLPYYDRFAYDTTWLANLPWITQARSRKPKLPRWFPPVPAATSRLPTSATSLPHGSTERLGAAQEHPDVHVAQSEDGGHKECEHDEHSIENEDSDDEEGGSDDEYYGYSDKGYDEDHKDRDCDDGYNDDGYDSEGYDDGAETNDELGFDYDDGYMS